MTIKVERFYPIWINSSNKVQSV